MRMSMRHFMNLVESAQVDEKYTSDNSAFRRYMKDDKFDPYRSWYEVCEWLENNDMLEEIGEFLGQEIHSADDLREEDPEIFFKLPPDVQKSCASDVLDELLRNDPAEAPTTAHMMLTKDKLLPRTTWLIHFSDEAQNIAHQGFTIGVDQMDKLGLTTYLGDFDKSGAGYNFAFIAAGRETRFAASKGKYGRDAVMFQNSGVVVHHHGDEEEQVVFHGTDVDPREIVLLRKIEGEWFVMNRRARPGQRDWLFRGDFQACEKWVMTHAGPYRGAATAR